MDKLKEFIVSIGIFLGLVSPQNDPELSINLFRTSHYIMYSLEIENCINEDIDELVAAANTVMVNIEVFLDDNEQPVRRVYHTISYDPALSRFTVYRSEADVTHVTDDRNAAYAIFISFYNLSLMETEKFSLLEKKILRFRADIELESQGDFDSAVLWNYIEPEAEFSFHSLEEIPY